MIFSRLIAGSDAAEVPALLSLYRRFPAVPAVSARLTCVREGTGHLPVEATIEFGQLRKFRNLFSDAGKRPASDREGREVSDERCIERSRQADALSI